MFQFPSVNELRAKFAEARYLLDEDTIRQVHLAGVMQKPILIEGPPGCGKTELAKALTFALNTKLERLQCYDRDAIAVFSESFVRLFSKWQFAKTVGSISITLELPPRRMTMEKDFKLVDGDLTNFMSFAAGDPYYLDFGEGGQEGTISYGPAAIPYKPIAGGFEITYNPQNPDEEAVAGQIGFTVNAYNSGRGANTAAE